ncbi:MAG: transketolase family protein [Tannerella sp.]|jgi:transketolase|nr:transketolase family protein [Tannerella sp.]
MKQKEMRAVYARTLIALAEEDMRIVLLEADLMKASGTRAFGERFPERTFQMGVAEANMVGVAAGLSATGKIAFADTFACFAARRAYDQFFISAGYARQTVKLTGTDPGIAAAYNGGTHMSFEDVGLMRNIPHAVVFEPGDPVSLRQLVICNARTPGCAYMRLFRQPANVLYDENESFELGRGKVLADGTDLALIASGVIPLNEALAARTLLGRDGLSAAVVDMHTVKPLDVELVLQYARKTGLLVTCENHQITNGLGSAVAETLAEHAPGVRLKRIGIRDEFGEVGTLDYLKARFGLTAQHIAAQAAKELSRNKLSIYGSVFRIPSARK